MTNKQQLNINMAPQNEQNLTEVAKPRKKSFYVTEILMLKSIVLLLILTFFLLNQMEAASIY